MNVGKPTFLFVISFDVFKILRPKRFQHRSIAPANYNRQRGDFLVEYIKGYNTHNFRKKRTICQKK